MHDPNALSADPAEAESEVGATAGRRTAPRNRPKQTGVGADGGDEPGWGFIVVFRVMVLQQDTGTSMSIRNFKTYFGFVDVGPIKVGAEMCRA